MYVCGRGCECGWVRLCVSAKLNLQHPPHHLPAPPLQAGARQLRRGNGHEQRSTHPHGISSITRRIEIRFASPPYACPPHTPPRNNSTLLPVLHRVHPCMHICICMPMHIYAHTCIYLHACMYVYLHVVACKYTYIHPCRCVCRCVRPDMYMCVRVDM